LNKVKAQNWLWLSMAAYTLIFSYFSIMRHLSSKFGDPDLSIFGQAFYTAWKWGMPFFNTFEANSHFAQHNSPIFYLWLPIYALHPGIPILLVLQSAALALGALPVFWLVKDHLGEKSALYFALLYLLYHPLQGINYDQFNELSFAVAPAMFALYYFLKRKYAPFWIFWVLALICKEDSGFVGAFWGLYCLGLGVWNKSERRQLWINGLFLLLISVAWAYSSIYIVIPHFKVGHCYGYLAERYGNLGNTLPEVILTIISRPVYIIRILLEKERLFYFLEMFLPLGFISFYSPGLLFMTIPTFAINMLSNYGMHNTGGRYSAFIIPFIFGSAILAIEKIVNQKHTQEAQQKSSRRLLILLFTLTILCTLLINCTPLRIGFKVPRITSHQKLILNLVKTLPPEASISTQADILQHVCNRIHAYSGYYPASDFILVDETSKWYGMHAEWDKKLGGILASGHYIKIYDQDGIKLYRIKYYRL